MRYSGDSKYRMETSDNGNGNSMNTGTFIVGIKFDSFKVPKSVHLFENNDLRVDNRDIFYIETEAKPLFRNKISLEEIRFIRTQNCFISF